MIDKITLKNRESGNDAFPYTWDSIVGRTGGTTVKDALDALEAGSTSREGYVIAKTASDFMDENTIYEIRDEIDLGGNTLNIPANSVLKFEGGSISNGLLNLNGCELQGNVNITAEPNWNELNEFEEGYKPSNKVLYVSWFGATGDGETDDAPALKRCIKWLHKNGATMVFDKGSTYILGDGIQDPINDPNKTLHTGYSYPVDHILNTTTPPTGNAFKTYIEANPCNIGRDIVLRFFRFSNLKVEGNGAIIRSHDGNGYCKHNQPMTILNCINCTFENFEIDGRSYQRAITSANPNGCIPNGILKDIGYWTEWSSYAYISGNSYKGSMNATSTYKNAEGIVRDTVTGFRQVSNINVVYGSGNIFRHIISRNSLSNGMAICGIASTSTYPDPHLATDYTIDNCLFTHAFRINLSLYIMDGCHVTNSIFQHAGYVTNDNGITNNKVRSTTDDHGANALVDLEDNSDIGINNVIFDGCTFKKSAKPANGLLFNRMCQNSKALNCYFEDTGVNLMAGVGGFNNEVAYCKLENSSLQFNQDAYNIHNNTVHIIQGDSRFWGSDKIKTYVPGRITDLTSGNASEKPSKFCDNVITIDYADDGNGGYVTPPHTIAKIEDNLIMDRNVFQNIYSLTTVNLFDFKIKSFKNNKFTFDTEKYSSLSNSTGYHIRIRPFNNGSYSVGQETTEGVGFNSPSDSGSTSSIPKGNTYNRPTNLVYPQDQGSEYYDIDLVKQIIFSPILKSKFDSNPTCAKNSSKYISNPYEENTKGVIRFNYSNNTPHLEWDLKIIFSKNNTDYSSDDYISVDLGTTVYKTKATTHRRETNVFTAPDPSVYPYIYIENNGDNTITYYFLEIINWWRNCGNTFTAARTKGTTDKRPTGIGAEEGVLNSLIDVGYEYFDTTLNKPIYASAIDDSTGEVTWVDATGTTIVDSEQT